MRPSEALALRWHDVREQTLLVERSLSLGDEVDTKTRSHRTVRLLEPLREDLAAWRTSANGSALLFPGHSFASLLLHEGRSVIYVARQLGHDARLTLGRYGHVIDELDDQPRLSAEDAIRAAREGRGTSDVPSHFPGGAIGDRPESEKRPRSR